MAVHNVADQYKLIDLYNFNVTLINGTQTNVLIELKTA